MKELTYNNSRKSMLPKDYSSSSDFFVKNYALVVSILASLGAFSIGTCIAWSSSAINILTTKAFPLTFENMTARQVSQIVSVFTLGAALSPPLVYKSWRLIGSKFFILISSGFFLVSCFLLTFFNNLVTILSARFLAGLATGCLHFIIPVYIQDVLPSKFKNTASYIWHSFLAFGILFQAIVVYINNMQLINIALGVAPLVLFCTFIFLPESPRYLCVKGNTNAAKDILRKFHCVEDDIEYNVHIWSNKKGKKGFFPLKSNFTLKFLLPALGLIAFCQLIGAWVGFLYMHWIHRIIGGEIREEDTTLYITAIFLVGQYFFKILGYEENNKKILIGTTLLMSISLLILGGYLHYQGSHNNREQIYYLPLICYGIFIFFYSSGINRLCWKYLHEITQDSQYFDYYMIGVTLNWAILCTISRSYPRLVETIGVGWLFWFMAFASFLTTIFSYFFIDDLNNFKTKLVFDENGTQEESAIEQI